jgi:hypothetical protein
MAQAFEQQTGQAKARKCHISHFKNIPHRRVAGLGLSDIDNYRPGPTHR